MYGVLDIIDPSELDILIFEGYSSGLISGKVDQFNKIIKVSITYLILIYFKILHLVTRDSTLDLNSVNFKIEKWIKNLENSEKFIEDKISEIKKEKSELNFSLMNSVNQLKINQEN